MALTVLPPQAPRDTKAREAKYLRILQLASEGKTYREIGELLYLSPRTIEVHVAQLCKNLEARGITHAVSLAIRGGLIK